MSREESCYPDEAVRNPAGQSPRTTVSGSQSLRECSVFVAIPMDSQCFLKPHYNKILVYYYFFILREYDSHI